MKILSLDSSSPVASVAFVTVDSLGESDPIISFQSDTPHARTSSSALFAALQQAVTTAGKPDALCVGLGPGSYNGLRAGIAAARGFATALDIPLHAFPSPLALPGPASGFWAIGDARGGHYWMAPIKEGLFLKDPLLFSPPDALSHLATQPAFPIFAAVPLDGIPGVVIATPDAARLAMLLKKHDPYSLISGTPEPLYLKPPHITAPRNLAS